MKIETKYNIHDEVFFMKQNRVRSDHVLCIVLPMITCHNHENILAHYLLRMNGSDQFEPSQLFATKEELLKSL